MSRDRQLLDPISPYDATTTPTTRAFSRNLSLRVGNRVRRWWVQAWQDVRADFKATKWCRGFLWVLLVCWIFSLLTALLAISITLSLSETISAQSSACPPDGYFRPYYGYSFWASSGFFQITLSFGQLTFTQAKAIDIIWDLFIGRVGQVFLALYSWKAFAAYIRSSMATAPVTYDTFFTVFLEEEASFRSTFRLIRDFSRRRGSKAAMTTIVLTMIYVLAWPTLASAMTGYTSALGSFVKDKQQNFISFDKFVPVAYIIHDGWRVNFTTDFIVPFDSSPLSGVEPLVSVAEGSVANSGCEPTYSRGDPACYLSHNVSEYVGKYGFHGLDVNGKVNDIETAWNKTTILRPALNISAFYLPPGALFGNNWTDPRTKTQPYADINNLAFTVTNSNDTYPITYIAENGGCQTLGTYQWGFSFLQLFIGLILMFVWTVAVYTIWLRAHMDLKQRGDGEVPTRYKSVCILASALDRELLNFDEKPEALTNQQLRYRISKTLNGGRIEMLDPLPNKYSIRTKLWAWMKRERWWILLAAVAIAVGCSFPPCSPFTFGTLLAVAIGTTNRSRFVIILGCLTIGIPVATVTAYFLLIQYM